MRKGQVILSCDGPECGEAVTVDLKGQIFANDVVYQDDFSLPGWIWGELLLFYCRPQLDPAGYRHKGEFCSIDCLLDYIRKDYKRREK